MKIVKRVIFPLDLSDFEISSSTELEFQLYDDAWWFLMCEKFTQIDFNQWNYVYVCVRAHAHVTILLVFMCVSVSVLV